jgi:prepilin-type N-terminal cleavage/methylation domain-containing protein
MGRHSQTKLNYIKLDKRGFTMIEMVMVLVIMAIFAAIVVSRASLSTSETNEGEILKSSIRFAQIKAFDNAVDTNNWGIKVTNSGASYELVYNGVTQTSLVVNLPGECGPNPMACISTPTHTLPTDITISITPGSAVNFNRWGSPGTEEVAIALKKGGSTISSLKVTPNTGLIQ